MDTVAVAVWKFDRFARSVHRSGTPGRDTQALACHAAWARENQSMLTG